MSFHRRSLMRKASIPVPVRLAFIMALTGLFAGCPSAPSPVRTPSPESERAKSIVQGTSTADFPATVAPSPGSPGQPASVSQPVPAPQTPQQRAQDIVTQSGGPAPQTSGAASGQPPKVLSPDQPGSVQSYELTPEERAFLTAYLSRLSYMVFYNDQGGMDSRLAKLAVSQANRYLIEKLGLSVLDFEQVERNKKDQLDAYQAETGGSIDLVQFIAQKFNADVYLEIDLKAGAEGGYGSYTATAQGTIKIYETSTGALLGSIAFTSPPTFSPATADAAIANAVAASVWQAMPRVTDQSKALINASLSRGVRYELIVQKTPDSRQMSMFERSMARKFRDVERLSYAPGETRFAIFSFQNRGKVEAAVYDASAEASLPSLYLVYMRGKSFTFNTGL